MELQHNFSALYLEQKKGDMHILLIITFPPWVVHSWVMHVCDYMVSSLDSRLLLSLLGEGGKMGLTPIRQPATITISDDSVLPSRRHRAPLPLDLGVIHRWLAKC